MTTLNKSARDAMVKYRIHACTDVTGFGLLGHSYEMAQGSDVELELEVDAIDLIPEALEFANMGLLQRGCTVTAPLRRRAWMQGRPRCASRTCSMIPRPLGASSWPWTRRTRRRCTGSCRAAFPVPSGSAS